MNPHHYRASHWINRGVFDGLSSFTEFESRIDNVAEEKDRGDIFEIFIEGDLCITRYWRISSDFSQ
jgi:hypothetical protein